MKIIITETQYKKLILESNGSIDGFIYELGDIFPEIEKFKKTLKDFITKSGCEKIEIKNLQSGVYGLSLHDGVVISQKIEDMSLGRALYVIFHEIAHQYQYKKYGKDHVYQMYLGKMDVNDATSLLRKIETTADEFALRKCRELVNLGFLNKLETPKIGNYKGIKDIALKVGIIKFRNLLKSNKITDTERISEILYNYIVNFKEENGGELEIVNENSLPTMDSKDLFSIFVGFLVDFNDKIGPNKTIEQFGAIKELRIYYENKRDGVNPRPLSQIAIKMDNYVKSELEKLNGQQLKYLMDLGKNVKTQ